MQNEQAPRPHIKFDITPKHSFVWLEQEREGKTFSQEGILGIWYDITKNATELFSQGASAVGTRMIIDALEDNPDLFPGLLFRAVNRVGEVTHKFGLDMSSPEVVLHCGYIFYEVIAQTEREAQVLMETNAPDAQEVVKAYGLVRRQMAERLEMYAAQNPSAEKNQAVFSVILPRQNAIETRDIHFTELDRELLAMISQGLQNKEIARRKNLSVSQVKQKISELFGKLLGSEESHNRIMAIKKAVEVDLLKL